MMLNPPEKVPCIGFDFVLESCSAHCVLDLLQLFQGMLGLNSKLIVQRVFAGILAICTEVMHS